MRRQVRSNLTAVHDRDTRLRRHVTVLRSNEPLPYLCDVHNAIKEGRTGKLVWLDTSVPVIACPRCAMQRLDDGTRCLTCDAYVDTKIQVIFEEWLRGLPTLLGQTQYDDWKARHAELVNLGKVSKVSISAVKSQ